MGWVIGIIVLVVLAALLAGPDKCDVCGLPLKKKCYHWKIEGRKQKLCPKCNAHMERKVSRDAVKSKFG